MTTSSPVTRTQHPYVQHRENVSNNWDNKRNYSYYHFLTIIDSYYDIVTCDTPNAFSANKTWDSDSYNCRFFFYNCSHFINNDCQQCFRALFISMAIWPTSLHHQSYADLGRKKSNWRKSAAASLSNQQLCVKITPWMKPVPDLTDRRKWLTNRLLKQTWENKIFHITEARPLTLDRTSEGVTVVAFLVSLLVNRFFFKCFVCAGGCHGWWNRMPACLVIFLVLLLRYVRRYIALLLFVFVWRKCGGVACFSNVFMRPFVPWVCHHRHPHHHNNEGDDDDDDESHYTYSWL